MTCRLTDQAEQTSKIGSILRSGWDWSAVRPDPGEGKLVRPVAGDHALTRDWPELWNFLLATFDRVAAARMEGAAGRNT
jgi:hypothetical protein